MTYYMALLKLSDPKGVPTGKQAKFYETLIQNHGNADAVDTDSDSSDIVMASAPVLAQTVSWRSTDVLTAKIGDRRRPEQVPAHSILSSLTMPGNVEGDGDTGNDHSHTSEESQSSDSDIDICAQAQHQDVYQPFQHVFPIVMDSHLQPGEPGHYKRLMIKCPLSTCQHFDHRPCQKYRSLGPGQMRQFGHCEPEAYLVAWADAAKLFARRHEHMQHRPSPNDIANAIGNYFPKTS